MTGPPGFGSKRGDPGGWATTVGTNGCLHLNRHYGIGRPAMSRRPVKGFQTGLPVSRFLDLSKNASTTRPPGQSEGSRIKVAKTAERVVSGGSHPRPPPPRRMSASRRPLWEGRRTR